MTIARKIVAGISALLALVLVLGLTFLHAATGARESLRQSEQARDLNEIMSDRIIDHLSWVDGLSSGLLVRGESFKGNLDPTTCALGKWMASFTPASEEEAAAFRAIDEPHRALHQSARHIVAAHAAGHARGGRRPQAAGAAGAVGDQRPGGAVGRGGGDVGVLASWAA